MSGTELTVSTTLISQETIATLAIDVRNDYHEENYITATFEFLVCEAYYSEIGADLAMTSHSYSQELRLYLETETYKSITWDEFTYTSVPC